MVTVQGNYCASKFFCPFIGKFLNTTDMFKKNTEDVGILLVVLQGDTAPPTFPPLLAFVRLVI